MQLRRKDHRNQMRIRAVSLSSCQRIRRVHDVGEATVDRCIGVCLCKIDGSARRQVVHFIECLYRPPVTRVGVGGTADRASGLLLLLSDAGTGLFICDERGDGG